MAKPVKLAQREPLEREKALYRYAEAFAQGDMDTIGNILREAEQDVILGQMIMELHEGYQQEERVAKKDVYAGEKMHPHSSTVVGISQPGNRATRPAKRLRRVSTFLQMIAAVLVCAVLVGGFLALFATRQGGIGRVNSSWCRMANPQLPGYSMILSGVTVVSANDVWAVGTYGANSGPQQFISTPLIEHWDGQQWRMMRTPRLPLGELQAVTALSATDVWAVGSVTVGNIFGKQVNYGATLVEHWDGTQWRVVPSPNVYTNGSATQGDTNTLMAVSALSPNDVWMVGSSTSATKRSTLEPGGTWTEKLIEHWDGKQVTIVPSPNPALTGTMLRGVAAIAPDNVWTVGWDGDRTGKPVVVEHWDGKQWSVVPAVEGYLSAISAVSAQDVWAVGGMPVPGLPSKGLVEHWDGSQWKFIPGVRPDNNSAYEFDGVAAISATDVWAVGSSTHNADQSPLIEHWDGKTWNIVSSPNPTSNTFGNYSLLSVSAAGEHALWSVGNGIANTGSDTTTLVERPCS